MWSCCNLPPQHPQVFSGGMRHTLQIRSRCGAELLRNKNIVIHAAFLLAVQLC